MGREGKSVSEVIYYNYVQTIEKLKRQYGEDGRISPQLYEKIERKAYEVSRDIISECLCWGDDKDTTLFNFFTREGNSRTQAFESVDGKIDTLRKGILMDFIGRKPKNDKETTLRNALISTSNKYSIDMACAAVKKCILRNNYGGFTRNLEQQGENVNYRADLMLSVKPTEIADVFLTSIINEHELEKKSEVSNKANSTQKKPTNILDSISGKLKEIIGKKHPEVSNVRVSKSVGKLAMSRATDKEWNFSNHCDLSIDGDLYAATDKGNPRENGVIPNQEDSVLIMYHPSNPDFKMLVVSDGMGGLDNGEMASSYVVEQISNWFNNLPVEYFKNKNNDKLVKLYESAIKKINKNLHNEIHERNSRGKSGATFCGAIVTEKKTIISNVGDSRGYTYSKGKLEQITKDDSLVYAEYEMGLIEKDDIRFMPRSNEILQAMGIRDEVNPRSNVISNSSYDCLMLVSDGVSDCLSDEQIKAITERTDRKNLAQMLIREAKARDSISKSGTRRIRAGKDNATVALYNRDER